ncbi:IS1595 family transposase [Fluviicola sp.]|jgi:transposase|uniref:IS1595 family transposase n=1 Tax=Fluviicola sp. TaxID=1917219 RepID=UPI002825402A|nr:IS1595 family transposase [Fluviicola sp.]MDR0801239.1 IS1595 family transposase [Fluviicola sp.]
MSNKYFFRSKISEEKFRTVLRLFCLDIEAKKVAEFTGLNRITINNIFNKIHYRIAEICEAESPFENGELELDESYFGARRVRGKRGRGARGKIPVFGMLKRGDKVYTQIVKNCSMSELLPIIKEKVTPYSVLYTDGFKTYDGLVNYGYKKHHRVRHGENEFADGNNHINGIENFWGLCKVRLEKFRGMNKNTFYLHIKECEFRYNFRNQNLYLFLLNNLRKNKLN